MIRVFIAESDELVHLRLETIINKNNNMFVNDSTNSGEEVVNKIIDSPTDVALIGNDFPHTNSIDMITELIKVNPNLIVFAIGSKFDDYYMLKALSAGAKGFIKKHISPEMLIQRINEAVDGENFLESEISKNLINSLIKSESLFHETTYSETIKEAVGLTDKELNIVTYLLQRLSNKEIAEQTGLSIGTVRNYLSSIYLKLNVNSRKEAINYIQNLSRFS